jgi:hypothetical protein
VEGGRWKPLHYQLRSSTFADQLTTCNTDGNCFAKNDSPFKFDGDIHMRLINVLSGASADMKKGALTLAAGPNSECDNPRVLSRLILPADSECRHDRAAAEWFCAEAATEPATEAPAQRVGEAAPTTKYDIGAEDGATAAGYTMHTGQIPIDTSNFTKPPPGGADSVCQAACDKDKSCLGYTRATTPHAGGCWLYEAPIASLQNAPGDFFFQKPGTAHIPAPPPPKPCLPPPMESTCTAWADTAAWKNVGCSAGGCNCVVSIEVTNSSGVRVMVNILPFQPPRAMRLPKAEVTATVGKAGSDGLVPIKVSALATAMFVVLTTIAEGRFSDNAFILEAGKERKIMFIPWSELKGELKVRVEHLADNLA